MANLAVPIPRTWTPGETEVGTFFNASVRDLGNFLLNLPIAQLVQATIQSIPVTTVTPITFDSTVADTYGGHSNTVSNSRYTAQVSGWYYVSGIVGFVTNTAGTRVARLQKNGSAALYFDVWGAPSPGTSPANPTGIGTSGILFLAAGDYVELAAYQTSGGSLNTIITGPQSGMSVYWLHT